ncbi:hypothetical protein [Solibacillus sp. FSL W8-0372]|uniref:hypothetical protein n=1 Tax=Solibacillus sp. FSL W8-0372 TaxID=2921713 RepID=UPI0030CAAB1E
MGLLKDEGRSIFVMVNSDNRQYTFTDVKNSAISTGDYANSTVTNNGISEDILKTLLKEIDASELEQNAKEELKELVETAQAESEADKPKQSVIKRMLEGSKSIIDGINSSPALIETYTKWAQFIQNPPTL